MLSRIQISAILATAVAAGYSSAATVGQYSFDTMSDPTDTPAGERLADSSGNNLHINRLFNSGVEYLSADIRTTGANPPPTGSLSLYHGFPYATQTPTSDRYSVAKTGEISAEFWFKPQYASTIHSVLTAVGTGPSNSRNSWGIYQTYPSAGKFGLKAWFYDNGPSTFAELSTPLIYDTDGFTAINPQWHHIAVTFDATKTGRMYLDGALVSTQSYAAGNYQTANGPLRVGADTTSGFTGSFWMDDLRVSDVALAPGAGTGVNELAWNTSMSQAPNPGPRPAQLGKQWVRSYALTISSWGGATDVSEYAAANFNSAVNNRSGYNYIAAGGIDNQMLGGFVGFDDSVITELNIASNAPRLTSYLIRDEIPPAEIPEIAQQAAYLRSIDSNRVIIAGLGSSGLSYIDNVVTNIQPDVLVHGYYPWQGTTPATDDLHGMLADWVPVRQKAMEYGLPVFAFIQSYEDLVSGTNGIDDNRRLPSESELRTEVFAHLSAGVQGLIYFVADARNTGGADKALINPDGSQSPLYAPAQQLNAEVARLGRSLTYLTSSDWRFVSGGVTSNPAGLPNWSSGAGSISAITGVSVNGTPTAGKDGLVGFFADDQGGQYFMLTNLTHAAAGSSDPTSATFTVGFTAGVNKIYRLSRITGEPQRVDLTSNTLSLTLTGGTGDLFKLSDGFFAGILPGDANLDAKVDSVDFTTLVANYGGIGKTWGLGDFDLDDHVTTVDFNYVAGHFGATLPATSLSLGSVVPEPASTALLALGVLSMARRRSGQARE